jgi:tRNA A37 threonylcarbamoyltransferase TsaD
LWLIGATCFFTVVFDRFEAGSAQEWLASAATVLTLPIIVCVGASLNAKTVRALDACGTPRVVVAGGVGANKRLRTRLAEACARRGVTTHYPRPLYCTDNAAMIALAGWYRREAGEQDGLQISARARWPVDTLRAPGGHLQAE